MGSLTEQKEKLTSLASLERALDVIECLDSALRDISISDISDKTGINKSTVFRILNTLVLHGYAYQNPETKKYGLSLALYHIGNRTRRKMTDTQRLAPFIPDLEQLSLKYNENVNVATLDFTFRKHMRVVHLFKVKAKYMLERAERDVSSMEAYTSAVGKCLLAFSPEDYISSFQNIEFEKLTPYTITDWDTLMKELELIRKRGYSECFNEHDIGISCIAAPIFSPNGTSIKAAISLSGDSERIQSKKTEDMIADLKSIARRLAGAF